jgi:PPP family 3-phenylpropionic acid transporter
MADPSSTRYGSFYGFYFAAAGVLLPYLGLFLDNAGFTPAQIGTTIALMSATKLVSPYLFAIWSDRARSREFALRVCIVAGVLSFAMFVVARGAVTWVVLLVVFTTIWNGVLPQFEALTIQVLGARLHRYAHIRIWGSVGYMIAVALLGYWFDRFGLMHYREVNLLLLVGVLVSAMCLPATSRRRPPATSLASVDNQPPPSSGDSISGVLRDRSVIWLLVLGLLMYASHGAYYGFFSLQLSAVGFDKTVIGLLWSFAPIQSRC